MEQLRKAKGFICDMDGVIYHGNKILPGVKEFVEWLYRENKQFLFPDQQQRQDTKELQEKLARMGLEVDEHHFLYQRPCYCRVYLPSKSWCPCLCYRGTWIIQRFI